MWLSPGPSRRGRMRFTRRTQKVLSAITGAQTPGWGGYDYAYLANAVDLIEPYDLGGNVDIVHALNPQMRIITTSFGLEPKGAHRVWHELLHGSRGLILWEPPDKKFLRDDRTLDARGRDAEPYFHEIRSGIGALLINSRSSPAESRCSIRPASMRTQWMLDWQAKGDAWASNGIDRRAMTMPPTYSGSSSRILVCKARSFHRPWSRKARCNAAVGGF